MAATSKQNGTQNDVTELNIDQRIIEAVRAGGFSSSWSIFCASVSELQQKTGLSTTDVHLLVAAAAEANLPRQLISWELKQGIGSPPFHLTTGCPRLDHFLGGGIPFSGITEIAGESSSGKTQLALQLTLNAQLPKSLGGFGKGVAYICTESQFPIGRLQQMIHRMREKYPQGPKTYTDHIFVHHISDMDKLVDCVQYQLPLLVSKQNVGLLIIDSVAAVFRSEEGADKSLTIQKVGYRLHQLASLNDIAVVAINQVAAAMGGKQLYGVDCSITPALGLSWANLITTRLMLSRTESFIISKDQSSNSCEGAAIKTTNQKKSDNQLKYRIRTINILFCPWLSRKSSSFVVTLNGIDDVDVGSSEIHLYQDM